MSSPTFWTRLRRFFRGFLRWWRRSEEGPEEALINEAAYEAVLNGLCPPSGWDPAEKAEERLRQLPDTLDGRRPKTLDDVIECVARDVTSGTLRARVVTALCRMQLMGRGVDPRVIQGRRVIGSLVPTFRRNLQAGTETGRLDAGQPGRN